MIAGFCERISVMSGSMMSVRSNDSPLNARNALAVCESMYSNPLRDSSVPLYVASALATFASMDVMP